MYIYICEIMYKKILSIADTLSYTNQVTDQKYFLYGPEPLEGELWVGLQQKKKKKVGNTKVDVIKNLFQGRYGSYLPRCNRNGLEAIMSTAVIIRYLIYDLSKFIIMILETAVAGRVSRPSRDAVQ